ncbi:uncharacterized protein TRUGW13939_04931 [Talaromyces rugulosus]|uniref:Major facilitator superfamily (MFS) profile domain-containing protein n=1 Tax=Talaromyces rugulosus TaxID=121627 RepID=A0A7H8QWI7_TALRU|nr:uncharacterized protein TRUGW13939_04931 [Talaromyces rugulosus]QKX57811.1 hypothetical protein TRUGW13939_04931 [Talaromyces rugulosus]
MQKYFGLRGKSLSNALVWTVIMPAYTLFGYLAGVAGGLLELPSWTAMFPQMDTVNTIGAQKSHNTQIQGTVVAIYTLGCLMGSLSCIGIGDKLGRRRTIMLGSLITCIGSILQSSSFSFPQLIAGRIITGLGFGLISATAPNWQTECSRTSHRGFVVMLEGLFISAGLAISGWVNYGMSHTSGDISWRFPLAFSCVFCIVVFLSMPLWPESPRWLVQKGRIDESKYVLAALGDIPIDSPQVLDDIAKIRVSLEETAGGSFRDIFRNGPARFANRAFIAAASQCFQQMSGINGVAFYQTKIFRTYLGLSADNAAILSASVFTWQTIIAPVGVFTIERFGRRKLMMFGAAGMGMCMAIIAGCVSHPSDLKAVHAAIVFVYLFSFFFVTGYLGLTFLYSSEIAPLSVRTPITALSTTSTWVFTFTVVEATPPGFDSLGWRYFIVYAVLNLCLLLPTIYFLFPETQGLDLESIDRIFLGSQNVFQTIRVAEKLRLEAIPSEENNLSGRQEADLEAKDVGETKHVT